MSSFAVWRRAPAAFALITMIAGCLLNAQDNSTTVREATRSYDYARDNILKSAQEMPENAYEFRPTPASRSFGELIVEAVRSQTEACALVSGMSPESSGPFSGNKADLTAALKRSAKACEAAYASVNRFNANQQVGFGAMRHTKLGLLFLNATHQQELYGQLSVYLELKGLMPPSRSFRAVPVD